MLACLDEFVSDLCDMIEFIEVDNLDVGGMKKFIDGEVLEAKYNGDAKDLEEYWPPRCVQDATKTMDENSFLKYGIIPFTFNPVEYESFHINQQTRLDFDSNGNKRPSNYKSNKRCTLSLFTTSKFNFFLAQGGSCYDLGTMLNAKESENLTNQSTRDISRKIGGFSLSHNLMNRCKALLYPYMI